MEEYHTNKTVFSNRVYSCLLFVVLDIISVNFSYFIALVIRFYFNSEFNSYGVAFTITAGDIRDSMI